MGVQTGEARNTGQQGAQERGDAMARVARFRTDYVVQGHYGHGWEDLTASHDRKEARGWLRDYDENEPAAHRLIARRVLKEGVQ